MWKLCPRNQTNSLESGFYMAVKKTANLNGIDFSEIFRFNEKKTQSNKQDKGRENNRKRSQTFHHYANLSVPATYFKIIINKTKHFKVFYDVIHPRRCLTNPSTKI